MIVNAEFAIAQAQWTSYTQYNSGMPGDFTNSIAVDSANNKWIGLNTHGVAKFDGVTWVLYNTSNSGIASNYVSNIAIDTNGVLWIACGDISKFDGTTWTTYNTSNSGLINNVVYMVSVDANNNKWFATYTGVSKFDGTTWTTYNSIANGLSGQVYCAVPDNNGNMWFGTSGYGAIKFDGVNYTIYNTSNSGLPYNTIFDIAQDAFGNIWFATNGYGVVKYDDVNWTAYNTSNSGLSYNVIQEITVDAYNNKWFGATGGGGVSKFDGTNWTIYNTVNSGLVGNYITSIVVDQFDNKWIGTDNGVSSFSENPLPINLDKFSATAEKCTVKIHWQSGVQNSIQSFVLERSEDGNNFAVIAVIPVDADGVYGYQDAGDGGRYQYYRLKIINKDGSYQYSQTLSAFTNCDNPYQFAVFPNPAGENVQVRFIAKENGIYTLALHDIQGRKISAREINVQQKENVVAYSLKGLATGMYYIRLLKTGQMIGSQGIWKK